MKISKSGLLGLSLLFTIMGLGLMSISMADRQLYLNLDNAVHFFEKVKFISTGANDDAVLSQVGNGSIKIQTNNFILTQTGDTENKILTGRNSSILGGKSNSISGDLNVILGGEDNEIYGKSNVILGGKSNLISGDLNVILGGKDNEIEGGNKSVILGSNNKVVESTGSVVVGNKLNVNGDYSAALGSGATVKANNSFLWNDGNNTAELTGDNLFVIMAKSGMIIGGDTAHSFAKLTIGGPLVVSSRDTDNNIQCGGSNGGGILKVVNTENQMCLCSCDGSGWNSMLGKGRCTSVCDSSIQPECGSEVIRIHTGGITTYSGSCNFGKPAKGTGSYFVDKNDFIHWSCETEDGSTVECVGTGGTIIGCVGDCGYRCVDGEDDVLAAEIVAGSDKNLTENTKKTLYPSLEAASGHKCAYVCDELLGHNVYAIDPENGKGYCRHISIACDEEHLSCESPLITGNFQEYTGGYTRDCFSTNGTKMNSTTCSKCKEEDLYYKDNAGICVKLTCHHCAYNGFPYCFPIDFSPRPLCDETNRIN